ncbi:hypothetical protein M569_14859, partial [Genlisea aurea]
PPLKVMRLDANAQLPQKGTPGAAGFDVRALQRYTIPPWGRITLPLGLAIILPEGTYGRLASRSGLAQRIGLEVGAGVIDADYRGEIKALLFNRTSQEIVLNPQEKIAQLIVEKI